jgi:hypothetical protein
MSMGGSIEGGGNINDLGGVTIVSPTNGQTLIYDASTAQWINSTGSGATGYATIEEQGTPVAQETTLNFLSPCFVATDNPGNFSTDITITGVVGWSIVTGATAIVEQSGYITNSASLITFTLPSTATAGSSFRIAGHSAGLWAVAQNAGQAITYGAYTSTSGVTGSLAATVASDSVEIICVVANSTFVVISSIGNLTVT